MRPTLCSYQSFFKASPRCERGLFLPERTRGLKNAERSLRKGSSMKKRNSLVHDLAEQVGEELGYEVVEVSMVKEGPNRILRVLIDHPEGIGVRDCETFSHRMDQLLDEEDPISTSYLLEISSPGVERPLSVPEHFQRFSGKPVEIRLFAPWQGQKRFRGILEGWSDEDQGRVLLDIEGEKVAIPHEMISRAHLREELF